ncbi:Por secretion system C-terminal sorting domain-containing protein [Saccharicrinis carchari]|uniref:Por secretion system C-terminal sorting domain-containing protein n=1 Tax=Saccharicrinis carchari TaxID=1168039 RepID=A0A521AHG1_SACCC|nr:T9SS type A sorting domain-containing protein [Saccharicrinis carchari]SMO34254.1 Por secretion system C-terminal sorting domain-containing protein [Saccharicrinis carchari]
MKTTFTLLIIIGLSIHTFAQHTNPFNKRSNQQNIEKINQLKSGHLGFLPVSITIDNWEDESWQFNLSNTFEYDEHGNVLTMTSAQGKTINTYDENNNLITNIFQVYVQGEGKYVNTLKSEFLYDGQNFQYESRSYMWSNDEWQVTTGNRTVREYDTNGNVISELFSMYQPGTGWYESYGYKIERIYSGALLTTEIWNNRVSGGWEPEEKTEFFYDTDNKPYMAREYEYNGSDFLLLGRYINVNWYLWNGNIIEDSYLNGYTFQTYNGTGDIDDDASYTNDEKMTALYPEGVENGIPRVAEELYQTWKGGAWVNSLRETMEHRNNYVSDKEEEWQNDVWMTSYYEKTYTTPALVYHLQHTYAAGTLIRVDQNTEKFDAFANLIEEKNEWHNGDANWIQEDGYKYNISYEGSTAKILERITMVWNSFTGAYVNETRETYEYGATNINEEEITVSVYPTIIDSKINIVSDKESWATFYSLTGSVVLQKQVYAGANNVSTSELPAGYYILKVNKDIFKVIKK